MADLALPDAVNTAEALLDPVRIPRKVVVHHEVGTLQVEPLARSIGRKEDDRVRVVGEAFTCKLAILTACAAVDRHHRICPAEEGGDLRFQVFERVAMLREDNDFAGFASPARSEKLLVKNRAEFDPLLVIVSVSDLTSKSDEFGKDRNFSL